MNKGTLYIVATPIGNLGDITLRAIETLKEADYIACEDTRHTLKLLNSLGIKNKLISYFEHSTQKRAEEIIALLEEGNSIALVSDAGMPIISDPGEPLTRLCYERGISVTCVPGACAAVTAVALSGIGARRFTFEGFLPKDKAERKKQLEVLIRHQYTTIMYESPHAIKKTLMELSQLAPERNAAVLKELTKLHEQVKRGTLLELYEEFSLIEEVKGEFVIVLEGCPQEVRELTDEDIAELLTGKLAEGMLPKMAINEIAQ